MVKDKKDIAEEGIEGVEQALSKTERYIEENQKSLTVIIVAIVAIVGIYLGYKRFIVAPQEKLAQEQMFVAEQHFEKDSFRLALNGDGGGNPGFIEIIDEYGITKTANLANYYAGICYLRLGEFDQALEYLKQFNGDDKIIGPLALGAIGDAYIELGKKEEAVKYYIQAAEKENNEFTSPIFFKKAGQTYEMTGQLDKAIEAYTIIKEKYPNTTEGRQIEKYITKAKIKQGK